MSSPPPFCATSSPVRTAAAIAAAAAVFLAVVVLAGVGRLDTGVPAFLEEALGPEKAEAPLERTPATGVDVRIHDEGYTVSHWGVSALGRLGGCRRRQVAAPRARCHARDDVRHRDDRRQRAQDGGVPHGRGAPGREDLALEARVAPLPAPRPRRQRHVPRPDPPSASPSITMDPVRILDGEGKDVTPEGLRWGLEEGNLGWFLTLKLDDADLPLPYVIDPAVTHRASATTQHHGPARSVVLTMPAGVQDTRTCSWRTSPPGWSNVTITTPAGWTVAGRRRTTGTIVRLADLLPGRRRLRARLLHVDVRTRAERGGRRRSAPSTASRRRRRPGDRERRRRRPANDTRPRRRPRSRRRRAQRRSPSPSSRSGTNSTYSPADRHGPSSTRPQASRTAVNSRASRRHEAHADRRGHRKQRPSTVSTAVAGRGTRPPSTSTTSTPTGSLTDPGSPLAGTVTLNGTREPTRTRRSRSVLFQRSPADAGTWTDIGTATRPRRYSVSFDTTGVADGLYDLRVVVTDAAGNVTNSTDRRRTAASTTRRRRRR